MLSINSSEFDWQVTRLEEELAAKNKAFRILEEKLKTQEDYEEIKRELRFVEDP